MLPGSVRKIIYILFSSKLHICMGNKRRVTPVFWWNDATRNDRSADSLFVQDCCAQTVTAVPTVWYISLKSVNLKQLLNKLKYKIFYYVLPINPSKPQHKQAKNSNKGFKKKLPLSSLENKAVFKYE